MEKEYYSINELSKRWGLCKKTLYRYIKGGKLKAFNVGNKFLISKEEVERMERGYWHWTY